MTGCLAAIYLNSNCPHPHSNFHDVWLGFRLPLELIITEVRQMQDENVQAYADHNGSPYNDMANGMVEEDPQLPVQTEGAHSVVNTVFLVLVAGVQNAFNSSIEQLASDTDQVRFVFLNFYAIFIPQLTGTRGIL